MLTIQEVADYFRVTRKTVYNWILAGKLQVIRISGTIRVERSEVERLERSK